MRAALRFWGRKPWLFPSMVALFFVLEWGVLSLVSDPGDRPLRSAALTTITTSLLFWFAFPFVLGGTGGAQRGSRDEATPPDD